MSSQALRNISHIEADQSLSEHDKDMSLLTQYQQWLNNTERSTPEGEWRKSASEDYRFYGGKQDTQIVLDELAAQRRPGSVFNEIKPKVDTLIGLAAQLRINPAVLPTEDSDAQIAEILGTTFKFFRRKMKAEDLELECFEHTAKVGRSLQGYFIDTSNPFDPVIKSYRVESGRFWLDADSRDYPGMLDAKYLFIDNWLTIDEVQAFYPDFNAQNAQMHQGISTSTSGGIDPTLRVGQIWFDENNNKFRIIELWYRIFVQTAWFINPLTSEPDSMAEEDWPKYVKALRDGIPIATDPKTGEIETFQSDEPPEMVVRPKKTVKFAIFSGNEILERGLNPYKGFNEDNFPYTLYAGYRDDEEDIWFGIIKMMKDPQRGFNTIMRQLIHLLNSAPKGMLMHEEGAVLNIKEYKDRGSAANFDLKTQKGALANKRVQFTTQTQIPQIYENLLSRYGDLMKNLSGIQDVFLGVAAGSREPGITSQLRQQSGLAVLFVIFDNFRRARIHSGKQLLSFIQQYITGTKMLRIDPIAAPVVINGLNPDGTILNDISVGNFDLMVEEALEGSSMKMANAKILAEFAQNNPGAIPADVLLDQTNISFTAKQRIREFSEQARVDAQNNKEEELDIEWAQILEKSDQAITGSNINKARKKAKRNREQLSRSRK